MRRAPKQLRTYPGRPVADVQLSKGFIRIANDLYRALSLAKVTGVTRRVMDECMYRQYGWTKKGEKPRPFLAGGTDLGHSVGCYRESAARALSALVRYRMVMPVDGGYRVVKDYDLWRCGFHGDPASVHWTPGRGFVGHVVSPSSVGGPVTNRSHVTKLSQEVCRDGHTNRDEVVTPTALQTLDGSAVFAPLETVERQREETEQQNNTADAGGPDPSSDDAKTRTKPKRPTKAQERWRDAEDVVAHWDTVCAGTGEPRAKGNSEWRKELTRSIADHLKRHPAQDVLMLVDHLGQEAWWREQKDRGGDIFKTEPMKWARHHRAESKAKFTERVEQARTWDAGGRTSAFQDESEPQDPISAHEREAVSDSDEAYLAYMKRCDEQEAEYRR